LRYCINSVSLTFVPEGDPLPDPLGRGEQLQE
jgi:peptide-methionine (R)-S-oxide reductase